jgi:hypothetical protein
MRELPRGTVTFLFTDVEGSTRLLKQLRDGYGDVLAQHQQLLRRGSSLKTNSHRTFTYQTWASTGSRTSIVPNGSFS